MCNGSVGAKGPARIVDRLGIGSVPIGIESFADVAMRHVYVDKTAVIADLVDRGGVTLFCRPRRFGKSLMLRTLQCYFEASVEDWIENDRALFDGLAITDAHERHITQQGTHPVIYLSLNSCGGDTWEAMRDSIAQLIAAEYRRHQYLLDSPRMLKREARRFEDICMAEGSIADLEQSLTNLSTLLRSHHRSQVVILIDEYDKIVTEGYLHGYRDKATSFLKRWLTGALKSTVDLYLAALTGVQRISKESIFSDLNNFRVDTALDHQYRETFGFTTDEVKALASHLGHADKMDELASWYDGYDFGGEDVYNPWSVLNYLDKGCVAQPYWTNTSSNEVVRRLVERADEATNSELTTLVEGGTIDESLDLSIVYGQIDSDTSAIWSQLYLAGYVTTRDVSEPNNTSLVRRLEVPNLEVGRLFQGELLDRAIAGAGSRQSLAALHTALKTGNASALAWTLEQALLNTVSHHDLRSENACHMWLLSLLYGMDGYRYPRSNRENGRGRPDVICEPDAKHEAELPAIAVEVKFIKDASKQQLRNAANSALETQALPKRYAHGLYGNGVILWSIAFDNHKHVAISHAEL